MADFLKAKGLHTFVNELGEVPDGALLTADNVVIDRNGVIEPRRGINLYGDAMPLGDDRASQLFEYKNRILRHFGATIQFDSDDAGTFSSFSGSFNEVKTDLRIKTLESNGNLYFTSDEGIKKISARTANDFTTNSGYIVESGGAKALDVDAKVNYNISGFMESESKVAYRLAWGINDLNRNQIIGTPSSRTVVTNISTTLSANIDITSPIPDEVNNTDYFFQVFRTAVAAKGTFSSLDDVDPGDEMNLIFEASVTSTDISNGFISFTDISPEDFRIGALPLYTNPNTGQGILQANEKPPLCEDLALFKGSTFYANTKVFHRFQFNILSITEFSAGTTKFIIGNDNSTRKYTFDGETEITDITTDTLANTTAASYILMNSSSNERKYFFWFDTTGADVEPSNAETSGRIGIKVDISGDVTAADVSLTFNGQVDAQDDFNSADNTGSITVTWFKNGAVDDTVFGSTAPGNSWAINVTTQGTGQVLDTAEGGTVLLSSLASPAQAVDETARSLVEVINADSNGIVRAFYLSGSEDLPGRVLLENRSLKDLEFYSGINDAAVIEKFNPTLPVTQAVTSITAANPSVITSATHGLITGDVILMFDSDSTPVVDGVFTVTVLTANTFSIPEEVTIVGTTAAFIKGTAVSDNEDSPNRIYFSKQNQPEAVPIVNFIDVGPKDKEIRRILALRDSLIILKDDGVYRLVGSGVDDFVVSIFDTTNKILAPDSAVVLNNKVYALADGGVIGVTDTGVGIISRPIEDQITRVTNENFPNFSTQSFGVSYELDRAYILWLPTETTDTEATQAFRFNVFTNTWTRWTKPATCGIVNDSNNILYVGSTDTNFIEKERKNLNNNDYADRELSRQIISVSSTVVELSSVSDVLKGDALSQIQFLTISQLNRLLTRLDIDPQVADLDYFSSLGVSAGASLTSPLASLAAKLDSDTGVVQTDYAASISGTDTFAANQSDFNIIIDKLNIDSGVKFSDYVKSEGTITYSITIESVDSDETEVTLINTLPYLLGDSTIFKAIQTDVIWAPEHFGKPDKLKRFREGTILFEKDNFTFATTSYKSDLSPNFEAIDFEKFGTGDWGLDDWGGTTWGGEGSSTPFRTLIPRDKQKCRYINCRFQHITALEKFSILGISYVVKEISFRAYRGR